jgi:hypothetical protein
VGRAGDILLKFGLIFLAAASSAVHAEEYSWQLAVGASRLDADLGPDADRAGLTATRYFGSVDDTQGPYALAAFLNPRSAISFGWTRDDTQTGYAVGFRPTGVLTFPREERTDEYTVAGRYQWSSGWYAGGRLKYAETDLSPSSLANYDIDSKYYAATAGRYIGSSTTVDLSMSSGEWSSRTFPSSCPPLCLLSGGVEIQTDELSAAVFHYGKVGALQYTLSGRVLSTHAEVGSLPVIATAPIIPPPFINGGGAYIAVGSPVRPFTPAVTTCIAACVFSPVGVGSAGTSLGRFQRYSLAAELFPTAKLGIGLSYMRWDGQSSQDDGYALSTKWFFTRSIAAEVFVERTRRDAPSAWRNIDSTGLRLIGRF